MMRSAWLLLAGFLVVGCSGAGNPPVPAGVVIQGKLLKGGQPLSVPHQDVGFGMVEILLIRADGLGEPERALAKPDGTFEITGPGKGLSPGRYKVAVFQRDQGMTSDQLEGAFDAEKTPITIEIPASNVGGRVRLDDIDLETHLKKE